MIKEAVTFTCTAIVSHLYKWTWIFEKDMELESNDHYKISGSLSPDAKLTTTTLKIINPRDSDEGSYHCSIHHTNVSNNIRINQTHHLQLEGECHYLYTCKYFNALMTG